MKKILLIQYFFKPFSSNQSFRYEKLLGYLRTEYKIDVLTSHHHGLDCEEQIDGINIYRTNSKYLKRDFSKAHKPITNEAKRGLISKIFSKLWWPDFAFLWFFKALKLGKKLIEENDYEIIISGSFPFTSHLIGFYLKKRRRELFWIVDYIDPFSILAANENPSNNVKLYKLLNHFVEKRINKKANRIIIFEEAKSRFYKKFNSMKEKTLIIPPMLGVDTKQFQEAIPKKFDNDTINIIYLGQLYKSIRSPQGFLEIFEKIIETIPNITLHFIGSLNDCKDTVIEYQEKYKSRIKIWNLVPRNIAIEFLKGADILLNISNDSNQQLPGKMVEYVYVNKKIINYCKNLDNSSSKFLKSHDPVERIHLNIGDFNSIEENAQKLYQFIKNDIEIDNDIQKHLPENLVKYYIPN